MSDREHTAETAAQLSLLLADQGEHAEANNLATLASRVAPAESVTAQALARAATARVSPTPRREEAEALIRDAIAVVPSDMLELRALLHVTLAKVVASAGRDKDARPITEEATSLYRRKGNLVAAQHTSQASGPALRLVDQESDKRLS